MVTLAGNSFPLLVWGLDYEDACNKVAQRYPSDTPEIRNATIQ